MRLISQVFTILAFYCVIEAYRLHQRTPSSSSSSLPYYRRQSQHLQAVHNADVAIIGGGPAGTVLAWLLQEQEKCSVLLIDPRGSSKTSWYPNYGEWRDEWHAIAERLQLEELKKCVTNEWELTNCYFAGEDDITTLSRPYVRVDRVKMQSLLRDRYEAAKGRVIASKLTSKSISMNLFNQNLVHSVMGSKIQLDNGDEVNCKVLVDTSGLESRLTIKESTFLARGNEKVLPTGHQVAYGFIAHVDKLGPYAEEAMTLFDYRTGFVESEKAWLKDAEDRPTFMYAMPLGRNKDGSYRVFFEETSLVGRGKRTLSFEECKKRALKRLAFYDINIRGMEEEEYCYIPMGGELPDRHQRVIAFGGAANLVHPSTGYHLHRMLAASKTLAKVISKGIHSNENPDRIASLSYNALWNKRNRLQRDFQAYGGEYLMAQNVASLRDFFAAFFSVPQDLWSGFLAGFPGLPHSELHDSWEKRFSFALQLFMKMTNASRISMILFAITYTLEYGPNTLFRSLLPAWVFGDGPSDYEWQEVSDEVGNEQVKAEAREMIRAFVPTAGDGVGKTHSEQLPSPFNAPELLSSV
eukprot:gene8159-9001_t